MRVLQLVLFYCVLKTLEGSIQGQNTFLHLPHHVHGSHSLSTKFAVWGLRCRFARSCLEHGTLLSLDAVSQSGDHSKQHHGHGTP